VSEGGTMTCLLVATKTLVQFLALHTNSESHNSQRHRQTDARQVYAKSRSLCVSVRSANQQYHVLSVGKNLHTDCYCRFTVGCHVYLWSIVVISECKKVNLRVWRSVTNSPNYRRETLLMSENAVDVLLTSGTI